MNFPIPLLPLHIHWTCIMHGHNLNIIPMVFIQHWTLISMYMTVSAYISSEHSERLYSWLLRQVNKNKKKKRRRICASEDNEGTYLNPDAPWSRSGRAVCREELKTGVPLLIGTPISPPCQAHGVHSKTHWRLITERTASETNLETKTPLLNVPVLMILLGGEMHTHPVCLPYKFWPYLCQVWPGLCLNPPKRSSWGYYLQLFDQRDTLLETKHTKNVWIATHNSL